MKFNLLSSLIFSSISIPPVVYAAEVPLKEVTPIVKMGHAKVDLNTADVKDIAHVMKGIGLKRAQAIVTYRDKHHGFQTLEELAHVPGIGQRFVERHLTELQAVLTVTQMQQDTKKEEG
jgi:competence protein ComEA